MIRRQGVRFSLEGPVTVDNVRKPLAEGLAEIESGALEVDLGEVSVVDSSAIGMMLAWMRAAKNRQQSLSFFGVQKELASLAKLYGLSGLFPQGAADSPK